MCEDFATFNRAALGYSRLHQSSLFYYDVATVGLAVGHLRAYAGVAQEIGQMLGTVVAWEYRRQGDLCLCQCPVCRIGACPCPHATGAAIVAAWRDMAPTADPRGVPIVRSASCPAELDFQEGDFLVAVNGVATATAVANATIETCAIGAPITFAILRDSASIEIQATRR